MPDRSVLEARLAAQPRLALAALPTPLQDCPRLTAALGGPRILMKRDDLTGLALGGNKTRQLEFLLAEVQASGADVIVAGAGSQSNWCRQIAAAAAVLGLDCALVLAHGLKGPRQQGNLLLQQILGAEVTVVEIDELQDLPVHIAAKAEALRAAGRRPYLIAPFDAPVLARSAVGYVAAALELEAQCAALSVAPSHLYLSGANMTPAGLVAGMKALGQAVRTVVVPPILWRGGDTAGGIARIATQAAALLGLNRLAVSAADFDCEEGFVGPGYGILTEAAREAILLTARTEGILLDPVYTAKAMAGLVAHVRSGRLSARDTVVFLHTGGVPALFAYAEDLALPAPAVQAVAAAAKRA